MATQDETPDRAPEEKDTRTARPREDGASTYVYGIVPEGRTDPAIEELPAVGGDSGGPVGYVRHAGLAAAVSPLRGEDPLGKPEDLRAHARVLNTLAASGAPVLPFRFGTVFEDREAVAGSLLGLGHDAFAAALERLSGRAQFTLRAVYDEDVLLRRILDERPDIAELRASTEGLPEEAARYQQVRLGELVYDAVEARRQQDTADIEDRLGPLADAVAVSPAPAEDAVADVAFLVSDDRRAGFERTADGLARDWHGRVRLRLLGPLAPYDFVADAMEEAEGAG
jgi:hypothetical protein